MRIYSNYDCARFHPEPPAYKPTTHELLGPAKMLFVFQLLPLFVMKMFGSSRGFAGLFLATLYGGALRSDSVFVRCI